MLVPFGQNLYVADGPTVSFFGIPYPTRMAVARLSSGQVWVWSPISLTKELAAAVDALGPVGHIVSPNKLHHLFLPEWQERWPDARLYAPPGLARKRKQLHFDAELGDRPEGAWLNDIDQAMFRGSFALVEVVFFHRASRTAILGDLIQRFPESAAIGFQGADHAARAHRGAARQHARRLASELPIPETCACCPTKGARLEAAAAPDCTRRLRNNGSN